MTYNFGNLPANAATELVFGQFEEVQAGFQDVLYPELQWRDVLLEGSLLTGINPGATAWSTMIRDWRGKGAFRGRHDTSVPTVAFGQDKAMVPIEVGGVTAKIDREDVRQYQFGQNSNLLSEIPQIMRMASERHFEGTFFYGDDTLGFQPWLDYIGVSSDTAPNGAGGSPLWANKTNEEIIDDVNDTITAVWTDSKFVHMPGHVALDGSKMGILASRKMEGSGGISLLKYLTENNIFTNQTGRPLTFVPIRYLSDAGAGSTSRMVVFEKMERNHKVPFPIFFELLAPQERGYDVELFAEYKFGSNYLPYPGSMAYLDGI